MKIISTLFTLLICSSAIAQLSVRNDAYVFVNDEVIFVENEVRLFDANSSIYLRNESQLLQGAQTIGNVGIGRLSTFQNGTANNYAYNYWCSPVGNTLNSNNLNRAFIANNQVYDVTAATPISSNIATYRVGHNGTSSPLVISSRWIYSYNPGAQYSEWDYMAETGTVAAGYGFVMKGTSGSGNNQLYDYRGKPNSGTITTAVLNGQETLVGNPYPSALDAADYIWDTLNQANITGTLYFWEQDLAVASHYVANYVGGYATYTITNPSLPGTPMETFVPATFDSYNDDGSLNTTGSVSSSGKTVKRYIPIGQGFMIEGTSNLTARTTNAMRDYVKIGAESEFFRTSQESTTRNENRISYTDDGLSIVPEDYKRFRLNIDFNELYTRQLVHNFHSSATEGFDYGMESKSSLPIESDAYWLIDNEPFAAQALSYNEELRIPLNVTIENQQLVRFRIFDIQNFDESQSIYIHDIDSDLYVDLRSQNYELTLEQGNYTSRFEIVFRSESLGTEDFTFNDFEVLQNNNAALLTIINPRGLDIKSVSLYDVGGKEIFKNFDLRQQIRHTFSTKNLSDGVYIANVALEDGNTLSKKVVISN